MQASEVGAKHSGGMRTASSGITKDIVLPGVKVVRVGEDSQQGLKGRPVVWTLFPGYLRGGERVLEKGVT